MRDKDPSSHTLLKRLQRIVGSLRAHGIEPHIGLKTSGKAARALAREAVTSGDAPARRCPIARANHRVSPRC